MPGPQPELLWDFSISGEDDSEDYAVLAGRALTGALDMPEMWRLSEAIRTEPGLALEIGLVPASFPALVRSCPDLALCLLVSLEGNTQREE